MQIAVGPGNHPPGACDAARAATVYSQCSKLSTLSTQVPFIFVGECVIPPPPVINSDLLGFGAGRGVCPGISVPGMSPPPCRPSHCCRRSTPQLPSVLKTLSPYSCGCRGRTGRSLATAPWCSCTESQWRGGSIVYSQHLVIVSQKVQDPITEYCV